MINSVETMVKQTIEKFVTDGFMFTGFDVTRTVRILVGKATYVAHSDVNSIVQEFYSDNEMDQYVRDLIDINGNNAYLYSHSSSNISNYQSDWIKDNPTQNGMKVDITTKVAPVGTPVGTGYAPPTLDDDDDDDALTVDAVDATSTLLVGDSYKIGLPKDIVGNDYEADDETDAMDDKHQLTKEGRLQIPISMVRTIGLKPSQSFTVIKEYSKLTLYPDTLPAKNTYILKVNKDGRVRLSNKILKSLSMTPKKETFTFEVDAVTPCIVITKM